MAKQAFPPLLPPGRHVMTVDQLRAVTVTAFMNSKRRAPLFTELERLINDLNRAGVICELWIDGSYLTQKPEPDDIDLSFAAWADHLDNLAPELQNALVANLNGGKVYSTALDTYFCPRFPRDDPRRSADTSAYWGEKWGLDWNNQLKGYAVVKLGETDVGHRLFA